MSSDHAKRYEDVCGDVERVGIQLEGVAEAISVLVSELYACTDPDWAMRVCVSHIADESGVSWDTAKDAYFMMVRGLRTGGDDE